MIPETGGVPKVRWTRKGIGKRRGVRVVYFFRDMHMPLFLPLACAKAQREDMTPDQNKQVRALALALAQGSGRKGP